jgi:hypothetical protein
MLSDEVVRWLNRRKKPAMKRDMLMPLQEICWLMTPCIGRRKGLSSTFMTYFWPKIVGHIPRVSNDNSRPFYWTGHGLVRPKHKVMDLGPNILVKGYLPCPHKQAYVADFFDQINWSWIRFSPVQFSLLNGLSPTSRPTEFFFQVPIELSEPIFFHFFWAVTFLQSISI